MTSMADVSALIPEQGWISTGQIAKQLGVRPAVLWSPLSGLYARKKVERRIRPDGAGGWEYRRA